MSGERILIVEDEMITAMDEKDCLESLGYQVVGIVASGDDAIKMVDQHRPDLVVMDITLEGEMDGVEAAWKIRDDYETPVIFVTAHGDKTLFEGATYGSTTGNIIKPFDEQMLKKNIEAALQGKI